MTSDPLLGALADARTRKEQAVADMRLLLAYAREIVTPRPYRLADLAQAAGMSISGVRTAYTDADVQYAAGLVGTCPRQHTEVTVAALLTDRQHPAAREHNSAA